ncbi:hypothetical protein [Sphingomonas bacterium]|uniref:hypothetical protein n=1 Tax=Sphingomonas bacterium TaxID=1895847 RepID=UPI001576F6B9|nr:hypothetical protein [Sphingomonas bacterium]
MATSFLGSLGWSGIVIFGFVILAAAIAYAALRNRQTPRQERATEDATRALYDERPEQDETPR